MQHGTRILTVVLAIASLAVLFPVASRLVPFAEQSSPAFAGAGVGPASIGSANVPAGDYVDGEVILQLHLPHAAGLRALLDSGFRVPGARTGIASLDSLIRAFRVREMRPVLTPVPGSPDPAGRTPVADYFLLRLGDGQDAQAALAQFRRDPAVRSAQLNYRYAPARTPNDPLYPQQWAHPKTSAPAGWDITTGQVTPRIVIAVIGEGIDLNHIDLRNNIVPGFDLADNDSNPSAGPGEVHETMVAGVAAATADNRKGVAGVCWGCGIMLVRVTLTSAGLAAGIDYAVTHGARVVNLSYAVAGPFPDPMTEASVNNADAHNVVVVASAGNSNLEAPSSPGGFDNALGVGGTIETDARWSDSNFGSWVDVSAPSSSIYTTYPGNNYVADGGTSFSAPYAAGLAGLILSRNPNLTSANVRHMIEYSADHVTTDHFIGGRINVLRSLSLNGEPTLYAVIKSPDNSAVLDAGPKNIFGTSLGTSYLLEYRLQGSPSWNQFGSGSTLMNGVLGSLDATPLGFGRYDIRLTASSGGSQDQNQITVMRSGTYPQQAGWPRSGLPYSFALGITPLYADFDRNGSLEVAASGGFGTMAVLNANGTFVPGWPTAAGSQDLLPLAAGDIDGDGDFEVVVGSTSGVVYALHHDATTVTGFPQTMDSPLAGPAVLANLDADPALEVIAVSVNGSVYVWNGDGTSLGPAWPKVIDSPVDAAPAVGDVDGDGALEIVVRQSLKLYVFNPDGSAVSGWPVIALPSVGVAPVLGDIDANGSVEIVEAEQQGSSLSIVAYRGNGTVLMRHDFFGGRMNALALGDLDEDGNLEILMTNQGGAVSVFDRLGNTVPGWPVQSEVATAIRGSAIVADIDGDGHKDILAGSTNGRVYGWNRNGTLIFLTPAEPGGMNGTPAVGDVDGDGDVEILFANNTGPISILDLPGAFNPATLAWPMLRGDARRTGQHRVSVNLIELPNSDAGPNQGAPTPFGPHYLDVDDDPNDGDTTILTFSSGGYKEVYTTADQLLDTDFVTSVKVRWVAKKGSGNNWQAKAGLVVGGQEFYGPTVALPTNYTIREEAFPTIPTTGLPWTVQDVRAAKLIYQQVSISTQLPRAKLTEIVLLVTVARAP